MPQILEKIAHPEQQRRSPPQIPARDVKLIAGEHHRQDGEGNSHQVQCQRDAALVSFEPIAEPDWAFSGHGDDLSEWTGTGKNCMSIGSPRHAGADKMAVEDRHDRDT